MHAAQAIQCMEAGKHVQVEIPLCRQPGRRARRCWPSSRRPAWSRWSATPAASIRSHQYVHNRIVGRRARRPADGRADLFLPPQEHQRQGRAAVAGPTICSGTMPRTRSICSPIRPGRSSQANAIEGPHPSRARHRHGHVDPAEERERRDLHLVAVASTMTGRSAPSSATSATTAPGSPATTISSPARRSRSTSAGSTSR